MKDVLASLGASLISFTSYRFRLPAIGVAAAAVFLLGSTSRTEHPNASVAGFTSFDASGAGTTANALQGTAGFGINGSGEVVGIQTDSKGVHHGIIRAANGTITQFDAPDAGTSPNQGTLATGIDAAGDVTGYYTDSQQAQHGYVRTASGTLTEFDAIAGSGEFYNKGTNPIAINDSGTVTGQFYEALSYPANGTPVEHGFIRAANGAPTLFDAPNAGSNPNTGTTPIAMNASGAVAGYSGDANRVFHGFVRAASGTITQFDATNAGTGAYTGTIATAIDAAGDIAGPYIAANGSVHGYVRLASGSLFTFDAPGAGTGMLQGTFPIGINSAGTIVGFDFDSNFVMHGFTRTAAGTITTLDAPGAGTGADTSGNQNSLQGTGIIGINDSGAVAGSYLDSSSITHGFVLAAPASIPASFTVSGTAVSVAPGAGTGNTSTITVTPAGGFTGAVALTASVAGPTGAQDLPTVSFGSTTPVTITGTSAGTATLTIYTTAASSASLAPPLYRKLRWYGAGGAVLACVLFFGVPARKRGLMRLLSLVLFFAAIGSVLVGCSGSGGHSTGPTQPTNPGTTAGTYTITVNGASGATTGTGTVTLTVQ